MIIRSKATINMIDDQALLSSSKNLRGLLRCLFRLPRLTMACRSRSVCSHQGGRDYLAKTPITQARLSILFWQDLELGQMISALDVMESWSLANQNVNILDWGIYCFMNNAGNFTRQRTFLLFGSSFSNVALYDRYSHAP